MTRARMGLERHGFSVDGSGHRRVRGAVLGLQDGS
jgi:hypothetical protein